MQLLLFLARRRPAACRTGFTLAELAALLVFLATVAPAPAQDYEVLYNFGSNGGGPTSPADSGIIAQGRDGAMYSTAPDTLIGGSGTAFRITPNGILTVLHSFNGADGQSTQGGLTLGIDGRFYGTSFLGGTYSTGTIFRLTSSGELTTLYNFNGAGSTAPPVQAINGNFYGRTSTDEAMGDAYRITPSGVFTDLHAFDPCCTFGFGPPYGNGPLFAADDGFLYGTLYWGIGDDHGVIFRLSESGAVGIMHRFNDGIHPVGPLAQGSDGSFYGVTYYGGTGGTGVIFQLKPDGTYDVLYNFSGGTDGAFPTSGLVQATDGNFYGTTSGGGTFDAGVLYRLTPSGQFSVLHNFDCVAGCQPMSVLFQHTNGKLYGMTASGGTQGGSAGDGVFFSYNIGAQPFVSFLPQARKVGAGVQVFGRGFTGTTTVAFNGISASFVVVSNTFLTATVPEGAETGFITVTTPHGTLTSNRKLQVRPQIRSFSPASGPPGTTVVINGDSYTGTTKVTFGGNNATNFAVVSDKQITAVVPVGARTGNIGITTTGAPSYSSNGFTVTP